MTEPTALDSSPIVVHHPQARPFWEAAARSRFILPRCGDCGRFHWFPRTICPFCHSDDLTWTEATGRGRIEAFTLMRRAKRPYVLAYVTLDEGPTMLTNIVDAPFETLTIGQPVAVTFFETEDGRSMPQFTVSGG